MILSRSQKQLILSILKSEQNKLFSKYHGKLLNRTVEDMEQILRNEMVNDPEDKGLDYK
ncbi:hypothetical protein [Neobacillus cucumis]|uniref:hypothetical protein n=1 Tax=Neobacillus cucumis TaxID=1740721 RepID=UPI001965D170|nr:hypothetical protein [Neobacillus cucumis]MBM7651381.1 hypothetical protein [Neobacillus cucumis]MDR4947767.1 hypothetical protein [Neobacillus cucumis]MED4229065.1 hypothetical protein [Neobacillus cucumis]